LLERPMSEFLYRAASPNSYRVSVEGVSVGSISKRRRLKSQAEFWQWGVDVMPLLDRGGRVPDGEAESFEVALEAFKHAFIKWQAGLPPGEWTRNRDHKKAHAERRR
jgi:hypothetical protein